MSHTLDMIIDAEKLKEKPAASPEVLHVLQLIRPNWPRGNIRAKVSRFQSRGRGREGVTRTESCFFFFFLYVFFFKFQNRVFFWAELRDAYCRRFMT